MAKPQNNKQRRKAALLQILTTLRKKLTVPQISGLLSSVKCEELSDWTMHDLLLELVNEGKVVKEIIPLEIKGVTVKPAFWHATGVELIEEPTKESS